MTRRHLVMLMGPPGCGKSTYARRYPLVVSTDALRAAPRQPDGTIDKAIVERVYEPAFDKVTAALKANRTIVFDSPSLNAKTRARALRIARAYKARTSLVIFVTPLDICLERQRTRSHPVPDDVVEQMHEANARERIRAGSEGWDEITTVGAP